MSRHRWGPPVVVEVPWNSTGGNLYTCTACGTTRQSEPGMGGIRMWFTQVFTAPDGTVTAGKTPPCQPCWRSRLVPPAPRPDGAQEGVAGGGGLALQAVAIGAGRRGPSLTDQLLDFNGSQGDVLQSVMRSAGHITSFVGKQQNFALAWQLHRAKSA